MEIREEFGHGGEAKIDPGAGQSMSAKSGPQEFKIEQAAKGVVAGVDVAITIVDDLRQYG